MLSSYIATKIKSNFVRGCRELRARMNEGGLKKRKGFMKRQFQRGPERWEEFRQTKLTRKVILSEGNRCGKELVWLV